MYLLHKKLDTRSYQVAQEMVVPPGQVGSRRNQNDFRGVLHIELSSVCFL
jgi:hypothetical protein